MVIHGTTHEIPQLWDLLPFIEDNRRSLHEQLLGLDLSGGTGGTVYIHPKDGLRYALRCSRLSAGLRSIDQYGTSCRHPLLQLAVCHARSIIRHI